MSGEPTQRKLILYMSMSLDGFAARRDGTMDWLGERQPYGAHRQRAVAELLGQTDELLLLRALELYELAGLDFADAYLVASAEVTGVGAVMSFDRGIDRVRTAARVEP